MTSDDFCVCGHNLRSHANEKCIGGICECKEFKLESRKKTLTSRFSRAEEKKE